MTVFSTLVNISIKHLPKARILFLPSFVRVEDGLGTTEDWHAALSFLQMVAQIFVRILRDGSKCLYVTELRRRETPISKFLRVKIFQRTYIEKPLVLSSVDLCDILRESSSSILSALILT